MRIDKDRWYRNEYPTIKRKIETPIEELLLKNSKREFLTPDDKRRINEYESQKRKQRK